MLRLDRKTVIIASVILAIFIIIVVIVIFKNKPKSDNPDSAINITKNPVTVFKSSSASMFKVESYPLAINMQGANVVRLQNALNANGERLEADGYFGSNTQLSLIKVTGKNSITEEELASLSSKGISSKNFGVTPADVNTVNGISKIAFDLHENLVNTTVMAGRDEWTNNQLYNYMRAYSDQQFKDIYNTYVSLYKTDLANDIYKAYFNIFTDVDNKIIDRAKSLNLAS